MWPDLEGWQRIARALVAREMVETAVDAEREHVNSMVIQAEVHVVEVHLARYRACGLVASA